MNQPYTVILIDDDILVLQALRDQLQPTFPYVLFETCQSGEEALDLANHILMDGREIAAVISDHLMDGMTGAELLIELQTLSPKTRKIMLTGQAGLEAVSMAVNAGALYRYINKPWDAEDMRMTLHEALLAYTTDAELFKRNTQLEQMNGRLETEIHQRTQELMDKNKELEEGLEYAGKVQQTLFPEFDQFSDNIRIKEIFLRPFDKVSGDFYWMSDTDSEGQIFVAVGDCIGHGIAGGFMSVMHIAALNEAMFRCATPSPLAILTYMNARIKDISKSTFRIHRTFVGAETTLLSLEPDGQTVHYASNSKGFMVRDLSTGMLSEPLQGGKFTIDSEDGTRAIVYGSLTLNHPFELYVFTDGVVDQFGGQNGKKLKRSGLREWISERGMTDGIAESFGEFFHKFSVDQMVVDDALMLILSSEKQS